MPSDPSAPSFDLDDARALSRRLGRVEDGASRGSAPRDDDGPAYTPFDASRFVGAATPPTTPDSGTPRVDAAPRAADAEAIARHASDPWEELLDWFVALGGGHTCFLMDPQGLCAASRGPEAAQADAIGPRLMIALEQAARMEVGADGASSVAFEVASGFITGVSVAAPDGSRVTVGLMSDGPVDRAVRETVAAAVRAKLATG